MHRNIPEIHPAAVIVVFHTNVHNRRMRAKMNGRLPKTINKLYTLADKCARAEEGRRLPGEELVSKLIRKTTTTPTPPGRRTRSATRSDRIKQ